MHLGTEISYTALLHPSFIVEVIEQICNNNNKVKHLVILISLLKNIEKILSEYKFYCIPLTLK